ncbi:MAG: ATP-binding cassette domain-containing protein, partial [Myxococcales bacterium]
MSDSPSAAPESGPLSLAPPPATGAGEVALAPLAPRLLQLDHVAKYFAQGGGLFGATRLVRAVDDVSLYVRRGETVGLVGESGCGKSTLGRLALRLIEPSSGRISFDGREITRLGAGAMRPLRRRMQIVFQDPFSSLNPRMTVGDIIAEGLDIHGLAGTKAARAEKIASLLTRVGLRPDLHTRFPHEFSGGQRQRIGIARALAVEPEFMVCDEPTSALDVSIQAQIVNLLLDLQESLGLAYLLISHDLKVVEFMSHRVAVMYLGRIVESGPTPLVFGRRAHPYTRSLFSALPVPDPGKRTLRVLVEGDPPSPIDPPPGCAFHPRCHRAQAGVCDVETPALRELVPGDHHRVACHFPEEFETLRPRPGEPKHSDTRRYETRHTGALACRMSARPERAGTTDRSTIMITSYRWTILGSLSLAATLALGVVGCAATTSSPSEEATEAAAQPITRATDATGTADATDASKGERGPRGPGRHHGPPGPDFLLQAALHELTLTDAQKTTIQGALDGLRPAERAERPARDASPFKALAAGVRAGKVDASAVPDMAPDATRMAEHQTKLAAALTTLHDTLTAEQRRSLVDSVQKKGEELGKHHGPGADRADATADAPADGKVDGKPEGRGKHGRGGHMGRGPGGHGGPGVLGMLRDLDLTDAQKESIDKALE